MGLPKMGMGNAIAPKQKLAIGKSLQSPDVTPDLASQPGGLSLGAEDALSGIKPSNRRLAVKGVLGARTLSGTAGAPGVSGRFRRLGR